MTHALHELKVLNVLDPCYEGQLRGSGVDPRLHFVMKLEALRPGPSSLPGIADCCRFFFDGFGRSIVDKA